MTNHAEQSARVLGNFPHDDIADNHTALSWAQVHATLALVEQQRIANLIALWALPNGTKGRLLIDAGRDPEADDDTAVQILRGVGFL